MKRFLTVAALIAFIAACAPISRTPSLDQAEESGYRFTIVEGDPYDCRQGSVRLVVWSEATFVCPGWRLTGSLEVDGTNIDVQIDGMRRAFRNCDFVPEQVPAVYRECLLLNEGRYRLQLRGGSGRVEAFTIIVANSGPNARIDFQRERGQSQPYLFTPDAAAATVNRLGV